MSKDKLVLKDKTEIELEAGASLGALHVESVNRREMMDTWGRLTQENLEEVQICNGAGLTVGTYMGLILVSETSVIASDGTVLTTYSLRPKTDVELLAERVAAVEEGQQVQDGAINDVATLAGTLAEQVEGKL